MTVQLPHRHDDARGGLVLYLFLGLLVVAIILTRRGVA